MIKYCETCGKEIPRGNMSYSNKKYQAKKYCNNKFHHQAMKKEFEYKCTECGEKVIRTKEGIKTNIFCDDVCKGRYAGKNNKKSKKSTEEKVVRICLKCNKEDVLPPSKANSKFCSTKCRAEYNAKIITEKQKNQVTVSCDNCNDEITRRASSINKLNCLFFIVFSVNPFAWQ